MKNKDNKIKILSLLFVLLFVGTFSLVAVRAEDDDEDEYEEQEDREDDDEEKSSGSSGAKTIAQTTSVSKSVETVILKDSDGDGILDKDDKHPNMAEIYIVEDNNKNGIVDKFEK